MHIQTKNRTTSQRPNSIRAGASTRLLRTLAVALLFLSGFSYTAGAQSGLETRRDAAVVAFPDEIRFEFDFQAPGEVKRVTLLYSTNAQTCQNASARQNADFEPDGDENSAEWIWILRDTGSLPPGAQLTWQWEVITTSGETFTSSMNHITIEDERYAWHSSTYGGVSVYWNQGDAVFGQRMQQIGIQSLGRLTREMGIAAPTGVRLMVYPGPEEVQGAGINLPDWTGGFAVSEYSTVMLGIAPNELDWASSIIPHELAHLVSDRRIFNCKGADMPTWLNEGISVAAEGEQDPEERKLVLDALQEGRLPSLRSLANGFAANAQRANLSYAQSGMLVRYFIKTYGSDGMDRLLQAIQDGKNIDRALDSTLGLDTEMLDAAWRASLGYAAASGTPLTVATRTPRPKGTAIPTMALWTQAPRPTAATATPEATVPLATVEPTVPIETATTPAAPPTRQPIWPYLLAGSILLAAGIFLGIRRSFRR